MRLCFGRMNDLEFVPEDKEDGWHREFWLVDYNGKQISPKVIIWFDDERNQCEPWYTWELPLYEIDKDKLYLNNIYNYLLTIKQE